MIKKILGTLVFLLIAVLGFTLFWQVLIPETKANLPQGEVGASQESRLLRYLALGDSLTEGVGDSSQQGGFVGLVKEELARTYQYKVRASNYGVAGNTSQQILKRMKEDASLKKQLQEANLLTLTVGGNDLIRVIRQNLSGLTEESFNQPIVDYQSRLREMIELARQDNPNLPIYMIGIYNPFYLTFPNLTEIQEVVDRWNRATEAVSQDYSGVYFVPINDLLYKGTGEQVMSQPDSVQNDVLFSEDNFHPNTVGYQIVANAVMEKLNETREAWQK